MLFMPTLKKRLNITLSQELDEMISLLSKRDDVPNATKASELLCKAIEIEEDEVFNHLSEQRDTKDAKFISHKDAWS